MDERASDFVTTFKAFLEEVISTHRAPQDSDGPALLPVLSGHLGADPRRLPVVTEDVPPHQFVDLDIALDEVQRRAEVHETIGIGGGDQRRHQSLSEILHHAGQYGQYPVGAVDYASIATGPDTSRQAVSFGLRLFRHDGAAVAVLQRTAEPRFGQATARMEIVTTVDGVAAGLIETVRALMLERSVLRGQVLSLGVSAYERGVGQITFHRRPAVVRADIILPEGVLERVHRHVAGIAEHRDRLRSAGQHLKRGLLLYGPPGTGKTHTVRYLLSNLPDVTVILLAGPAIAFVAEAAKMARALQPALVVLEDCDLVAESRDLQHGPQPLLFAVLETLDGLGDDADVAFLLTTNRIGVLEPALAQRPGRVDLAVEIPLPDEDARRRLMRLYARDLPFTPAALDRAAGRAVGVTASFVKELLRRSVLIAAEAGHDPDDGDLAAALDEMLSQAESITRSLLGTTA
ncbi:AAA family ATPase [Dactylosporangium siamense]|uniref:ATPase n=1 Tax=Dactylosporangium siamense TaxID=685454 RepID=A0A919PNU7_9ACTN|nr:ATP-binding protein [Dactylosporangium siamense]GIG47027.1 ATPase [Dactylosporangium siamense]